MSEVIDLCVSALAVAVGAVMAAVKAVEIWIDVMDRISCERAFRAMWDGDRLRRCPEGCMAVLGKERL